MPTKPTEAKFSAARSAAFWLRAALFCFASNAAILFVLKFGLFLWPERLPANSQNIFWLASGVNVAGLLVLGLRYWPVLLLNAFPAWWLAGEPLDLTTLGSLTNALEALLAAWLIQNAGARDGLFDNLRKVGALLGASFVSPAINTLIIPAYLCTHEILHWRNYGKARELEPLRWCRDDRPRAASYCPATKELAICRPVEGIPRAIRDREGLVRCGVQRSF